MHFALFYEVQRWQMRYKLKKKTLSMQPHGFPTRRQTIRFIHSFIAAFVQSVVHAFIHIIFHSNWICILTGESAVSSRPSACPSACPCVRMSHSRMSFINLNNVNFLPRLSLAANPGNPPVHLGNGGLNWNRFPFSSDKQITIFNLCDSPWSFNFSYLFMIHVIVVSSCRINGSHFIFIVTLTYRF